jgi:hypothetical protein
MLANITLKQANVTLQNVVISSLTKTHVSFKLTDNLKNATIYQLLDNISATIDNYAYSKTISVIVKREHIDISFV